MKPFPLNKILIFIESVAQSFFIFLIVSSNTMAFAYKSSLTEKPLLESIEIFSPSTRQEYSIASLPCPTSKEARRIIQIAKIDIDSFPNKEIKCDESQLSLLIRLLLKFESLRISIPKSKIEKSDILRSISSPWNFFVKSFEKIDFYESKRAYTSFKPDSKTLSVSYNFFKTPWPHAIATLIHEAAHGRPNDPGHRTCRQGDLIYTSGACDETFESTERFSGAYSFEFWFLWYLSQDKNIELSAEMRSKLQKLAIELLNSRFNYVYGKVDFNDLIVALLEDGAVGVIDPLTDDFIHLPLPLEKTRRLFQNQKNLGVGFRSSDGKISTWSAVANFFNRFEDVPLDKSTRSIKFFGRIFNPIEGASRTAILNAKNEVWIVESDLEKEGQRKFVQLNHPAEKMGEIKSFLMLQEHRMVFLFEDGNVALFDGERVIEVRSDFPKDIRSISSDYLGLNFYLLDSQGKLYFADPIRKYLPGTSVSVLSDVKIVSDDIEDPSIFGSKYLEGVGLRGLLTKDGRLLLRRHGRRIRSLENFHEEVDETIIELSKKIVDFGIIRSSQLHAQTSYTERSRMLQNFEKSCDVQGNILRDPWLKRPVGINSDQKIVIWQNGDCRTLANRFALQSLSLEHQSIGKNPFGYRESIFKTIDDHGNQDILRGYFSSKIPEH